MGLTRVQGTRTGFQNSHNGSWSFLIEGRSFFQLKHLVAHIRLFKNKAEVGRKKTLKTTYKKVTRENVKQSTTSSLNFQISFLEFPWEIVFGVISGN